MLLLRRFTFFLLLKKDFLCIDQHLSLSLILFMQQVSTISSMYARNVRALSTAVVRGNQTRKPSIVVGAASVALISAAYVLNDQKTTASSESNFLPTAPRQSAKFQALAAVEFKQEKQKLELARFLHDIHSLAVEEKRSKLNESTDGHTEIVLSQSAQGQISLKGIDLLHLSPASAHALIERIHDGKVLDGQSFQALVDASTKILMEEPSLVDLTDKVDTVTVVGDIHGSLGCLQSVLRVAGHLRQNRRAIVFNGDYIDRGENSVEVLLTLLLIKLAYRDNVILVRGNHECAGVASVYGFYDELKAKYGLKQSDRLWDSLSSMFAALPICVKTDTACILHGGIPKENFSLREVQAITPRVRSRMTTLVHANTAEEQLVQDILWSDPSMKNGINPNPRGCGVAFGPDVARDFLQRTGLKYVIRSHEPVEKGVTMFPCGDDRYIVTVFSTASYQGSNLGAIVNLDKEGDCKSVEFGQSGVPSFTSLLEGVQKRVGEMMEQGSKLLSGGKENENSFDRTLRSFISENRYLLEPFFQKIEKDGFITKAQWIAAMEDELGLQDVPWAELQPTLAPTSEGTGLIDWKDFLLRNNARKLGFDADEMNTLQGNNEKLLELFELIDTDCSGEISLDEFVAGIDLLNQKYLPPDQQIKKAAELFKALDTNGNAVIDMEEFKNGLNHSVALAAVVRSVSDDQLQVLQKNHAMLLAAFQYLDKNGNGLIDRDEFRAGIDLLNKRLPDNARVKDSDELFSVLDIDGSGEIDIQEFSQIFQSL